MIFSILMCQIFNYIMTLFTKLYYKILNILENNYIINYLFIKKNNKTYDNKTYDNKTYDNKTYDNKTYDKQQVDFIKKKYKNTKIKIGLLTNEIPPIVYGGVATWIVNFIKMFENDEHMEVIPIFLAHQDDLPEECNKKYNNIRVIKSKNDIKDTFKDIDVCINNLWVALDYITHMKYVCPKLSIISVCHSFIRMENITNCGSIYTNNFIDQEKTFSESDCVVLISQSELQKYNLFGYNIFDAKTAVIYNMYQPKFDGIEFNYDYNINDIGYIGRHVPRKRPCLPAKAVKLLNCPDIKVINMGVDKKNGSNDYWEKMEKNFSDILNVIYFTSDPKIIENFYKHVCWIVLCGIYEPFGYTTLQAIDRGKPIIVGLIDGPKEIVNDVLKYVVTYDVDVNDYDKDVENLSKAIEYGLTLLPEQKKHNALMARKCLDKFRPEIIKPNWKDLIYDILLLDKP